MSDDWTQQDCVACGSTYEFPPKRTGVFVGSRGLFRPLEVFCSDSLNPSTFTPPCPECGCVQPGTVAKRKRLWHSIIGLSLLVAFIVLLINGGKAEVLGLSYALTGTLIAIGSFVGLILHVFVAFADPNRHPERNLRQTSLLAETGKLDTVSGLELERAEGNPPAVSRWAVPLLVIGGLGGALSLSPIGLLKANNWPVADETKPEVVSVGDTVTVWFPDHIQAVNGYWNGQPQAALVNADGEKPLRATAQTMTWGDTIRGKRVNNVSTRPWAKVPLPKDSALVGATIEVRVEMEVMYPTATRGMFINDHIDTAITRRYTLAEPGASSAYQNSFWLVVIGASLMTVSSFGLWGSVGGLRRLPAG